MALRHESSKTTRQGATKKDCRAGWGGIPQHTAAASLKHRWTPSLLPVWTTYSSATRRGLIGRRVISYTELVTVQPSAVFTIPGSGFRQSLPEWRGGG